jgi:hypothetical protein
VFDKNSLLSIFYSLPVPKRASKEEAFSAQAVELSSPHRIGKDVESRAAILISVADSERSDTYFPVTLENISIRYNILCRVTDEGQPSRQGRFVVIRCESRDDDLIEYFLRTMEVHIHFIGSTPSCNQVGDMVQNLIELFRTLSQPSKQSVQGLWAELLVIAEASDTKSLLRSWHGEPGDRYDFSADKQCIEVKSSSGEARIHHFSLEQLNPGSEAVAVVISLFVKRSADGLTVIDIINSIRSQIRDDLGLLAHLHRTVAITLGEDWRQATSTRFDKQFAKKSIRIYDVGSIPAVNWPTPLEVTEVKFKSNLSRISSQRISSLLSKGGIFAAVAQLISGIE